MLQLNNICKSYTTGSFTQKALDNVSIAFRDNEFVAILGPSGSGKTTLLNIIGGLDHYDSGDLIIEGVSTKQYKDRDWDAYRNNRIGFVFQSYNLIPHQTVLANVELALTLSGVSRDERRKRAVEALERVGLGDHINKKPSQMSGGQMQRVAIARALINDPEILLADEPTGALDSKTSVQIMDLLTEIASDRLVVMVTHNPDLAEQYATRIVNLADGCIVSDSNPYLPTADEMAAANAKPVRRTRMSFLTALSLSANNLMTKKGRTLMTAIAGSIGIIGIAAILALANGVNNYIKSVEEETLSVYPLQILSTGFNFTSMLGVQTDSGDDDEAQDASASAVSASAVASAVSASASSDASAASSSADSASADSSSESSVSALQAAFGPVPDGMIGESKMMSRMFASIGSNDLASLKAYFDGGESGIENHVNAICYQYSVTPQIFSNNTEKGVRQVNPDTSFASLGIGSSVSSNSLMSMSMSTDMFSEMMDNNVVVLDQYEVVAGHWPEKYNELILVVSQNSRISDFLMYVLDLRDNEELKTMIQQFTDEQDVETPQDRLLVAYEQILGIKFKLVNAADYYSYDSEYGVWVDKTNDKDYMKDLVENGEDLTIVGIVRPKQDASAFALTTGLYYTPDLTRHIVEYAMSSQIVRDQLADRDRDVFSGRTFEELENDEKSSFDMSSLFTIDEAAIANSFTFNTGAMNMDLSGLDMSNIDMSSIDMPAMDPSAFVPDASSMSISLTPEQLAALFPELTPEDLAEVLGNVTISFSDDGAAVNSAFEAMMQGYAIWRMSNPQGTVQEYLDSDGAAHRQAITAAVASTLNTQALEDSIAEALAEKLGTTAEGVQDEVIGRVAGAIAAQLAAALQQQIATAVQQYMTSVMSQYMAAIQQQLASGIEGAMGQLTENLANAFGFDADTFANAFQFNMDEEELTDLMMSMMRVEQHSYDNNLKKLGYADFAKPSQISIYPKDFESKEEVITILNAYNAEMRAVDKDRVISYTDLVGTLMESVTDIVDKISAVLVAFVAISLIVSSIMIGVITYISVLERIKEIGILRSIGASKKDISHVFNAETVIEGLISGLLGVGITAAASIPANAIVEEVFEVPNIAILPISSALILVAISVALTFVAGLIPSRSAAKKDPVEALRSE